MKGRAQFYAVPAIRRKQRTRSLDGYFRSLRAVFGDSLPDRVLREIPGQPAAAAGVVSLAFAAISVYQSGSPVS